MKIRKSVLGEFNQNDEKWYSQYFDSSLELVGGTGDFASLTSNFMFDKIFDGTQAATEFLSSSDLSSTEFYSSNRSFEEVDSPKNGKTSDVNHATKLKCHTCHVRAELKWIDGHFRLYDKRARVGNSH